MTTCTINLMTTIGPITGSGEIVFTEALNTELGTSAHISGQGRLGGLTNTSWNLAQILDAGVSGIVAQINNKNYTMQLTGGTAIFSDNRAVYNGTSSGAIAAGVYTPALAINASGIAMGANRPSDGAWVNTVFISATTGNAAYSGQIASGSTITGNLQVATSGAISSGQTAYNTGTGYWHEYNSGTPRMSIGKGAGSGENFFYDGSNIYINDLLASTIVTGASNGTTALSTKLNKNAADVLGGNITFNSSGAFQIGTATWNGSSATGTGIMYNQYGIVAVNSGAIEFVLNGSTGSATFSGALNAATGTFSGSLSAATGTFSGSLAGANGTFTGDMSVGNVNTNGYVVALGTTGSFFGATIYGQAYGTGVGVYGEATTASNIGVLAGDGGVGAVALSVSGKMAITSNALVTNLNAQFCNGYEWGSFVSGAGYTFSMPSAPVAVTSVGWLELKNTAGTVVGHVFGMTP